MKNYYTYIMTNQRRTVLYTGVINNLSSRVFQHVTKQNPRSFTAKYNVNKLVYYNVSEDIEASMAFEKQIKNYSKKRKEQMITEMNPNWNDLSEEIGLSSDDFKESTTSSGHGIATLPSKNPPVRSQ